jgi:hypothetical protein
MTHPELSHWQCQVHSPIENLIIVKVLLLDLDLRTQFLVASFPALDSYFIARKHPTELVFLADSSTATRGSDLGRGEADVEMIKPSSECSSGDEETRRGGVWVYVGSQELGGTQM